MTAESYFISNSGLSITSATDDNRHLACIICENTLRTSRCLTIHYVIHHQLKYCRQCLMLFINDDDLQRHTSTHHAIETCTKCHLQLSKTELANAVTTHYRQSHAIAQCDFCFDLIEPIDEIQIHLKTYHNILPSIDHRSSKLYVKLKENLFFCQLCSLRVEFNKFVDHYAGSHLVSLGLLLDWLLRPATAAGLPSSVVTIDFDLVLCPFCDQKYTVEVPRVLHQIFCAGKQYCKECDQLFNDMDSFSGHRVTCLSAPHAVDKAPFGDAKCQFCDEFIKYYDRRRHQETHRIVNDSNHLGSKSAICQFCAPADAANIQDVRSMVEHYLNYHRMSHTCLLSLMSYHQEVPAAIYTTIPPEIGEATIDFDTRMVKFVYSTFEGSSSDEIAEQRRHHFQCQMCDHKAVSKLALINHMNKIHGFSIKPVKFRCRICTKIFSSLRTLRMHRRSKHWPIGKAEICGFCNDSLETRAIAR